MRYIFDLLTYFFLTSFQNYLVGTKRFYRLIMMKYLLKISFFSFFAYFNSYAMIFDNRYFPLFQRPLTRHTNKLSNVLMQADFITSSQAYDDQEKVIPLFQIDGAYDQIQLLKSVLKAYPEKAFAGDFIRSDMLVNTQSLPWEQGGRIDTQLIGIRYSQALTRNIIVGVDTLFAHINSHKKAHLDHKKVSVLPGDFEEILKGNTRLHNFLHVSSEQYDTLSWGDTDISLRLGNRWEYKAKFKAIDAGFTFGVIAPTAKTRSIFNPASIPLGGNGHWGLYGSLDADFNVKEDWRALLLLRVQKRLPKTSLQRIPVGLEPLSYGALVANTCVNPGLTFIVMPTIILDGLRDNFGIQAAYTLVVHRQDCWSDQRADKTIEGKFDRAADLSAWGSEYVTIGLNYDYSRDLECPRVANRAGLLVDIPLNYAVAKQSVKNIRISLSMESNF